MCASAQSGDTMVDSVEIHFRQSRINLVPELYGNRQALDRIADSLRFSYSDSLRWQLSRVHVMGAASPEGSVKFNQWLSEQRAATLFNYLKEKYGFTPPNSLKTNEFLGRDWNGLVRLVEADSLVPYRDEALALLRKIAAADGKNIDGTDPLMLLKRLRGGKPYLYMYHRLFPQLRASKMMLWYSRVPNPTFASWRTAKPVGAMLSMHVDTCLIVPEIHPVPILRPLPRNFYMSLRTNALYDLALIPNIGADFYLGRNWSVSAYWMYSWWNADGPHWYWRTYGGDVTLRRWFGKAAKDKPLTGHHLGIYAQALTYDLELGGTGYIAGVPGGSMFDKCNWGAGIEYGYSLPLSRRLNLDFTIAVGYLGGECWHYKPVDDCYVWQKTVQQHWFGPTKAEISLVWLIGRGNVNKRKGGDQ